MQEGQLVRRAAPPPGSRGRIQAETSTIDGQERPSIKGLRQVNTAAVSGALKLKTGKSDPEGRAGNRAQSLW